MREAAVVTPDEQAVKAALAGNMRAFDELVERYFGMIYMIAYAHLGDRHSAEDLAQEAFLRAYLHLANVDPPSRFSAWLSQIVRNLARDWLKREQRISSLVARVAGEQGLDVVADSHTPDPSHESERCEMHKALRNAMIRLPVEQREIVLLHYAVQLDKKQIAERLGVHPGTVGRQMDRALQSLRGILEEALGEAAVSLNPPRAAVVRTVALVAAVTSLSPAAKAAVVATVADTAHFALPSLAASGGAAGVGGCAGTLPGAVLTGVKTIMAIKLFTGIAASGLLVGGLYYYFDSYGRSSPTPPASAVTPNVTMKNEPAQLNDLRTLPPQPQPTQSEAEPEVAPAAPPPARKQSAPVAVAEAVEDTVDLATPRATVTSFTRFVGKGDWKKVIDCFLPGGVDYQDTIEIANATPENRHAYKIRTYLEAIDPDKPAEVVSTTELPDGQMKVVWKVTLKAGIVINGGQAYSPGDTMEYDATLRQTPDGRWMIDNF